MPSICTGGHLGKEPCGVWLENCSKTYSWWGWWAGEWRAGSWGLRAPTCHGLPGGRRTRTDEQSHTSHQRTEASSGGSPVYQSRPEERKFTFTLWAWLAASLIHKGEKKRGGSFCPSLKGNTPEWVLKWEVGGHAALDDAIVFLISTSFQFQDKELRKGGGRGDYWCSSGPAIIHR